MAVYCELSIPNPNIRVNRPCRFLLQIFNTGGTPVTISNIAPYLLGARSGNIGGPYFPPGATLSVGATSNIYVGFDVTFFAPSTMGATGQTSGQFNVGCNIQTSDGTATSAPERTIAAGSAIDLPAVTGSLDFTSPLNSNLFVAVPL